MRGGLTANAEESLELAMSLPAWIAVGLLGWIVVALLLGVAWAVIARELRRRHRGQR